MAESQRFAQMYGLPDPAEDEEEEEEP